MFGGKATINVKDKIIITVATVVKKDIAKGEKLDRIGGYCFAGIAIEGRQAKEDNCLPLALAEDSIAAKNINKGSLIKAGDVIVKTDTILYNLYSIQNK